MCGGAYCRNAPPAASSSALRQRCYDGLNGAWVRGAALHRRPTRTKVRSHEALAPHWHQVANRAMSGGRRGTAEARACLHTRPCPRPGASSTGPPIETDDPRHPRPAERTGTVGRWPPQPRSSGSGTAGRAPAIPAAATTADPPDGCDKALQLMGGSRGSHPHRQELVVVFEDVVPGAEGPTSAGQQGRQAAALAGG